MANKSMYRGDKRFDKEQLEFFVNVILSAAIDRIECVLPQTAEDSRRWVDNVQMRQNIQDWKGACLETAGMGLAVLWAQTAGWDVGEGFATQDALEASGLEAMADRLISQRFSKRWKDAVTHDTTKLAQKFVKANFGDYLKFQA